MTSPILSTHLPTRPVHLMVFPVLLSAAMMLTALQHAVETAALQDTYTEHLQH